MWRHFIEHPWDILSSIYDIVRDHALIKEFSKIYNDMWELILIATVLGHAACYTCIMEMSALGGTFKLFGGKVVSLWR
jgi:hypothetical protein